MAGDDNNNGSERPTALIQREALLGLIDQSAEREAPRPHTVSRELLRSRAETREEVQIVDVAPLQPSSSTPIDGELDDDLGRPLSPVLVLAVIAILLVTFIAATQLR